jgi:cardiolipin synthase
VESREPSESRYTSAVLTIPNLISFVRIASIPVFVVLLSDERTERAGLLLFAVVAATDWLDGYVARRTGQISTLGKLLDPTADRLAIAAGLIVLTIAGAVPLWAVLLVVLRDAVVLLAGAVVLATRRVRIDVRRLGKVATFTLMLAIVLVAWGEFELPLARVSLALGWTLYWLGLVESYVATIAYARDVMAVLRRTDATGST